MARVYAATHALLGREAAVKVISDKFAHDEDMVSRFFYEARIVNKLRHPNIVDIFDFVKVDQPRRVACVMEFLNGPSLRALLAKGRLPMVTALNISAQLANALEVVHAIGVIHRDLKPENVVVIGDLSTDLSAVPSLKLLDFGVAKIQDAQTEHQTATGMLLGTPSYMAPEQIAGEPVTPATDVYALGEIMFEMLVGRKVYRGQPVEILRTKLSKQPPDLRGLGRVEGLGRLEELIARTLAAEPEVRPTIAELSSEIRATTVAALATRRTSASAPPRERAPGAPAPAGHGADPQGAEPTEVEPSHPQRSGPYLTPFPTPTPIGMPQSDPSGARAATRARPKAGEEAAGGLAPPLPAQLRPEPAPGPLPDVPDDPASSLSVRLATVEKPAAAPAPVAAPENPFRRLDALPPPRYDRRSRLRPVLLFLLVAVLAGGFVAFRKKEQGAKGAAVTSPEMAAEDEQLRATAEAWKRELSVPPGVAVETFLADADTQHLLDTSKGYARADELYRKAVATDPTSAVAVGGLAENLAVWKGPAMTEAERELVATFVRIAMRGKPPPPIAFRASAALALASGDHPRAAKLAEAALGADAASGAARLYLATALLPTDPARALREAEEAVKVQPALVRSVLVRARALATRGRYKSAFELLDGRLEGTPRHGPILRLYGDLERELGRLPRARFRYGQAIAVDTERFSSRLALGGVALVMRDYRDAEEAFRAVVEDPKGSTKERLHATVGLARAMFAAGRPSKGSPAMEAAIADRRFADAARLIEGERALEAGDAARAVQLAGAVLSSRRGEPGALVLRARAQMAQAAGDKAARDLAEALATSPHDAEARAVYAGYLLSVGAEAEAFEVMLQAGKLDPSEVHEAPERELFGIAPAAVRDALAKIQGAGKDPRSRAAVHALLALVHEKQGNDGMAGGAWAKAAREDPGAAVVLANQIRVAIAQGAAARADAVSADWLSREALLPMAHLMRARALAKRGKKEDATLEYRAAVHFDKGLHLARVQLALLELAPGDDAGLQKVLQLIAEVPSDVSARAALFESAP